MEQQLLTYIEQELKRGVLPPIIKKALAEAGWADVLVEEAFAAVQSQAVAPIPHAINADQDKMEDFQSEINGLEKTLSPKTKKPLFVAAIIFGAMIVVFIGLIAYFSLSTPSSAIDEKNDFNYLLNENAEESVEPVEAVAPLISESNEISDSADTVSDLRNATTSAVVGDKLFPAATSVDVVMPAATTTVPGADSDNDTRRMADMQQLVVAQKLFYNNAGRYYTCGLAGGDCGGKPYGYPAQIGAASAQTSQDPLAAQHVSKRAICGNDYVYCGLNNAPYSQFFCYYAKLEGGGYYTASHAGNFKRNTPPKIFEECAIAN